VSDDRILNLAVFGDIHGGCKMGLMPREGFVLDEGNTVMPSRWQLTMADWWDEYWNEFVPFATNGEPFAAINMGDSIDGVHHRATTPITHNIKDQIRLAEQVLRPVVERCGGRYYHIRGTEAHVGQSAEHEEALAKMLGAIQGPDGQYSRWKLNLQMGSHRLNFMHHIGTASSPFAKSGALQRLAVRALIEAAKRGVKPYSMLVRGHRHIHGAVTEHAQVGRITVVTTPAWQGKTGFIWSKDGLQMDDPECGGIVIRLVGEELFFREFIRRPEQEADEII